MPKLTTFYNEIDQFCCAWISNLMDAGIITPGVICDRSIEDLNPDDLRGYKRAHFFAGIAVWDYALNQAGWPDDIPVWTGSCPCQSFSASGKRGGFSDKRHLWPAWFRLIGECRPDAILGEQVAGKDGLAWLDVVCADLERADYAIGPAILSAAGVGAPHIRRRIYFVADSQRRTSERYGFEVATTACDSESATQERERLRSDSGDGGNFSQLADSERTGRGRWRTGEESNQPREIERSDGLCPIDKLGNTNEPRLQRQPEFTRTGGNKLPIGSPGFTNGFWRDAEWLYCTDGKYRPTKPGLFPLATRTTGRVGILRGAGNALCAPVAQTFIEAYLEINETSRR